IPSPYQDHVGSGTDSRYARIACQHLCPIRIFRSIAYVSQSTSLDGQVPDRLAEPVSLKRDGVRRIGLIGTSLTMEDGFYQERMKRLHGVETIVPDPEDRSFIHNAIYQELCRGVFKDSTKRNLGT